MTTLEEVPAITDHSTHPLGNATPSPGGGPEPDVASTNASSLAIGAWIFAAMALSVAVIAWMVALDDGDATAGPAVAQTTVKVTLKDFSIGLSTATVPAGYVTLDVRNTAATIHNARIAGLRGTRDLGKGQSQKIDLGLLEPGKYEIVCNVPGHGDLGMKTILTVVASGPSVATSPAAAQEGSDGSGASDTEATMDWKAVDAAHERVVTDFLAGPPAATKGKGGLALKPLLENGVPVYNLTASVVQWEVKPGVSYEAWTYNGTVPGPEIRVKQGETVKVRLTNKLPESTSIHFHGLEVADNKQDGVTFVTQDPITPGQTYTYNLTPINCGSHMYHSHHAADAQVPLGLLGAFVVDCTTTSVPAFAQHDTEYTQVLTDGPLGFGINGKAFPATAPIVSKVGERTLIRFMNEGLIIHPMHLHGHPMTVVAKDGNYLPQPYNLDTLNIAPGERYDVIVDSKYPGAWAFHCHILTHAESPQGLHGMTTVWLVQP
jgi:manganese oxidase